MKNILNILTIALGVIIGSSSCKKDVQDLPVQSNGYKEKLKSLGFTKNVVEKKEHFIIDGDIRILKSDLDKKIVFTAPKLAQAYAGVQVSLNTITVYIDSSIPTGGVDDWRAEIANALSYWNTIPNFGLNFQLSSNSNSDIVISSDNGSLEDGANAAGGYPINNMPSNSIIINLDAQSNTTVPSTLKELIIAHEIGHNIGFRHTDYYNDYSLQAAYVLIGTRPSTSSTNNPDPASIMNSGYNQLTQTWRGFSNYDKIAIRTLYPLDNGQKPFYRYWNNAVSRHHYTSNWNELGYNSNGFNFEGIAGFIYDYNISGSIPWYRYYRSSFNNHYFSTNATAPSGYVSEGIAGYVFSTQVSGSIPLYQYYSSNKGHFYTTDFSEVGFGAQGHTYEGVKCYVIE